MYHTESRKKDKERILAIADVHGAYDQFEGVLRQSQYNPAKDQLVLLGDYVDCGPSSYQVVKRVMELVGQGAVALLGNHDDRFINREDDPAYHDSIGGDMTVKSYANVCSEEMKSHLNFLKLLPLYYFYNRFLFVHAGLNPSRPFEKQTKDDLIRIRRDWLCGSNPMENKAIVVFGHTSPGNKAGKNEVYVTNDRIGINTNGWGSGYLSLVDLTNGLVYRSDIKTVQEMNTFM